MLLWICEKHKDGWHGAEAPGVWFVVAFLNHWGYYSVNKRNSQPLLLSLLTFVSVYKNNRGDLVFYYNFVNLCNKIGKSPSAVAEEIGFKRSVVTRWSKGSLPRQATLQKIADYFGVSLAELTAEQKENPTASGEVDFSDMELLAKFKAADETTQELIRRALGLK